MSDPLLTSLCSICHVSPPKYRCPRCGFRTCSLPCTRKHKAWSECSGERDPTTYMTRSKLRTAAGIDHDYNFLHGLERSVERSERVVVGDRGLVREDELRPLTVQEVRWKRPPPGRGGGGSGGGRPRKVVVTRVLREAKGRVFERFLAQRLKKLNVRILCAPMGMARQKENHTTLNRRTGRINWQVEWLTVAENEEEREEEVKVATSRALSKVMDDVPLYLAYQSFLEGESKQDGTGRHSKRLARDQLGMEGQDSTTSAWNVAMSSSQDPFTASWIRHIGSEIQEWPSQRDEAQRKQFRFFLARPHTRSDLPPVVTKLDAGDCLRDILTNTRVLEYPTIYVARRKDGEEGPPKGLVLGPKDSVSPEQQHNQGNPNNKRRGGSDSKASSRPTKRNRREGGGGHDVDDEGEADDGSVKGSVGLEAGEVIDEQSFGEEDDEADSDDETSSSGSDSSDEEE